MAVGVAVKQRLVAGALVVLLAWPPVHMLLARRYGTDPWSLFGWGMYATPKPVVQVDLGEMGPAGAGTPWPAPVRAAAEAWRDRRRIFGSLLPPDALATEALAGRPELRGVAVRVRRLTLDPRTARFVVQDDLFACPRATAGDGARCGPLDPARVVR